MPIPRTIPSVLSALSETSIEDEQIQANLSAALSLGADVDRIVGAFDALKNVTSSLEADALCAFAGAAYLIAAHGWWGRQADATAALVAAMQRIPPPEPRT